ncbi:MAG TPA: tetratricopeptide repeat protein [bacterium]|nr:tetratricopeptide repeat protein [bacterium]
MNTHRKLYHHFKLSLTAFCAILLVSCSRSAPFPPEIRALIAAVNKSPKDRSVYEKLINALYTQKFYDDGLRYAEELLRQDPRSAYALFAAGMCSNELSYWDKAEEYFKRACAETPQDMNSLLRLALLYYGKGEYRACSDLLRKSVSSLPADTAANADVLILLAKAAYYGNDRDAASGILDSVMQYNFTNKDALYTYGLWKVRDRKYQEAAANLAKYISLYPDDPHPYVLLGMAYYHTGRSDYAEEAFLRAGSSDPSFNILAEIVHLQKLESTYNEINTGLIKVIEEYHYRDGGAYRVRGIVENYGLEVAKEVSVIVQVFDKKNNIAGQRLCEISPRNLRPMQYAFFQAELPYSKDFWKVEIKPNWEKRSARVSFK